MADKRVESAFLSPLELGGAAIQLCTAYSLLQEMNKPLSVFPYSKVQPYQVTLLLLELTSKIPVRPGVGWY